MGASALSGVSGDEIVAVLEIKDKTIWLVFFEP
jgi:hypothetical protein